MADQYVLVVGATVLYDYIFTVDQLPQPGQPAFIKKRPNMRPLKKFQGGTAFNIAVQLAVMGDNAKILHPVGSDFPNSPYEDKLLELGVNTEGLLVHPKATSGFAHLYTDPAGRTLCFTYPSMMPSRPIPGSIYDGVDWLVLTPSFGDLHEESLMNMMQQDSFSLCVVGMAHPAVVDWLPDIDLISVNDAEVKRLLSFAGYNSPQELADYIAGILIVTQGKGGCYVYEKGGKATQLASISTDKHIDPTGAGDAFAAAVIASLRRGYQPVDAARIGTVAASYVVEAVGCQTNMPSWSHIGARLEEKHIRLAKKVRNYGSS